MLTGDGSIKLSTSPKEQTACHTAVIKAIAETDQSLFVIFCGFFFNGEHLAVRTVIDFYIA